MSERRKIRTAGAYIIKAAESRPRRPDGPPPADYTPPVPTAEDRALARALLARAASVRGGEPTRELPESSGTGNSEPTQGEDR